MLSVFRPKLLTCLPGYRGSQLLADVAAGITVGVLALPLGMAFAIASGCSPAAGIWTSIVAGFLISLLGGSRVQIGGPTGAFIPIVYGIVAAYGSDNLLGATLLAGVFLVAMGVARLGQLVRFIPVTVVIGFTNGIAVVIFFAQLKDFFGLQIADLPAEFFARCRVLLAHAHTADGPTVALALASFLFLLVYGRLAKTVAIFRRVPSQLLALCLGTLFCWGFEWPVETIGSRFHGIPQTIPAFAWPNLSIEMFGKLISPAFTIALLGAIESLLSARVADGQIDDRHDPNQELLAQGVANIVAPLFGGFAATGAIARTTTNIRAGGRTPIAGMVHALVLLGIVLTLAPLAAHVPLATLSAIVMVTALNMGEWHEFLELRRYSLSYRAVLLSTFFMTVLFDLTVAVELGMVMACLAFMHRMSDLTRVERLEPDNEDFPAHLTPQQRRQIGVWALYGSLFFGAVNKLEQLLEPRVLKLSVVVLDMSRLIQLDTTGLEGLENLRGKLEKVGCALVMSGLNPQPASLLRRSGFLAALGNDQLCLNLEEALQVAGERLARSESSA